MPSGVLKPAAVRLLASIVDRHCASHGIRSPEARESVAVSALRHYQRGATSEEALLNILAQEDDPLSHLKQPPKTPGHGQLQN